MAHSRKPDYGDRLLACNKVRSPHHRQRVSSLHRLTLTCLDSRGDVPLGVVYFGRSLGAAVAVEMGTRHPPVALILESAFPSVPYMARRAYPLFPVWPFLRTRYNSQVEIAKVNAPLLMLHGDRDGIAPIEAGRRLLDAAREPRQFYIIRGAGHNDTYRVGGRAYFDALRSFVERLEM